ncbi:YqaJ viral recombinase family protein [Halobacillus naozhouensis]|uniref:YqaJ viral recombinase family protein n=1 Tax=Halobacillus naozhouensis TaxID=554880 RepID=A0ABY8J136_9BACI|nr:YqaJ viral recombinase family protein [Halobacillus naozhouensis]WFT76214.1 YqaJ viral recombinase family protein [Halobacillus naozhouensis]
MGVKAQVLSSTADMEHKEWLESRKKGIGGSDAASIAGLNKWKSPMVVYMEKIGEAPNTEPTNEEAAYWGNVMEATVAQEFSRRTGLKVRKRNAILQHPEHEWMLANVDRLIVGKNEGLECKTASEYLKGEWDGEEIPGAYLLQCQHYMAVTGADAWWIAVLIGGNKFVYKKIDRDEELIAYLIDIEKEFWEGRVVKQEPPEIDGSEASSELLKALYPQSEPESETDLDSDTDKLIEGLQQVKEEMNDLNTRKKKYENQLKQILGTYEKGFSNHYVITYKSQERRTVDSKRLKAEKPDLYDEYSKVSSSRPLKFKEAK